MLTRSFHIKSKSDFGKKLPQQLGSKRAVAHAIVDQLLWPNGVDALFINDGTSTSYVWCYYLRQWVAQRKNSHLDIWTNNYDIAMQALCEREAEEPIRVRVAPGKFSFRFCATLGPEADKWVADNCKDKTCILAVTQLDAEYGPCGRDDQAKQIKRTILERAGQLIVVADSEKLSKTRNTFSAASVVEWKRWLTTKKDQLWVFTDLDPALSAKAPAFTAHKNPTTESQWQEENARLLSLHLRDHFVYVAPLSSTPCAACTGLGDYNCSACDGNGYT